MANQQNQNQRPQRKDFMRTVVIGPNAQIVDQREWQKVAGDPSNAREFRKALKENNWTSTRIFDGEGYDAAVKEFRDTARSKTQETRKSLFQQAFEEAGVEHHPRVESALRTVLPLMDPEKNETRVVRALGKIVAAVDSVMLDDKRVSRNKANARDTGGKQAEGAGSGPGHQRGESGEGGVADNGQKLRKDGQPDQRTKGDDMEEAPGQETRRANGNQSGNQPSSGQNNQGGGQQARGNQDTEGSDRGGNSKDHPGAETDAEGHRINQDGSIDKRTKGENEDMAEGQKTRAEHGLQGTTKAEGGNSNQGNGRGNQSSSSSSQESCNPEQLDMIAKVKEQYDQAVDKAMKNEDMDELAEVKRLYDIAVEQIMAGETVDDMFSVEDGGESSGRAEKVAQSAGDGRGIAKDPQNDDRRKPGGNNPEGINGTEND